MPSWMASVVSARREIGPPTDVADEIARPSFDVGPGEQSYLAFRTLERFCVGFRFRLPHATSVPWIQYGPGMSSPMAAMASSRRRCRCSWAVT